MTTSEAAKKVNKYKLGESDERPWGRWKVTEVGKGYIKKEIEVDPGELLSLQKHDHRNEEWIIRKGHGCVTLDGEKRDVFAGDTIIIPLGSWHRMHNTSDKILIFHETQYGDVLDENDIIRAEDKYSRAPKK